MRTYVKISRAHVKCLQNMFSPCPLRGSVLHKEQEFGNMEHPSYNVYCHYRISVLQCLLLLQNICLIMSTVITEYLSYNVYCHYRISVLQCLLSLQNICLIMSTVITEYLSYNVYCHYRTSVYRMSMVLPTT